MALTPCGRITGRTACTGTTTRCRRRRSGVCVRSAKTQKRSRPSAILESLRGALKLPESVLLPAHAVSPSVFFTSSPASREIAEFAPDAAASAGARPVRWHDPSSCSTAAGTTSPPSQTPPAGIATAAAGSSSPTAPDWSAGSGRRSTLGIFLSPVVASGRGTRPPAGTAP